MIMYIDAVDNKLLVYGYKTGIEKKLNETGPKKSFATMNGYNVKPINPTIPEYYFFGIYMNTPEHIEEIFNGVEIKKLFILANAIKLFNYIKHGQGINSYSDEQFKDPDKIKGLASITEPCPMRFMEEYIEELKTYAKLVDDDTLNIMHIDEDKNFWRIKTDRPRYVTGNTIVYYPETDDSEEEFLCVSNGIDEKEYIKPNEIGRVITEINYTLLDKGTPMERVNELYKYVKPHNRMGIPVLFKASTIYSPRVIRALRSYPKLKIEGFYNMMQYSVMDSTTVAFLYTPPALLYKIKDEVTSIRNKIMEEKDKWIDITEHFVVDGALKEKGDFLVKIPYGKYKVPIKTNVDTFNRNRLGMLLKGAKLYMYIYETEKMIRYYTILSHEGRNHISYAPHNNLIVK